MEFALPVLGEANKYDQAIIKNNDNLKIHEPLEIKTKEVPYLMLRNKNMNDDSWSFSTTNSRESCHFYDDDSNSLYYDEDGILIKDWNQHTESKKYLHRLPEKVLLE